MKAILFAAVIATAAMPLAAATADDRQPVTLPADVKDAFLSEMRGHLGNLDDIMAALAEGDFKAAARTAGVRMDFGHSMWETMAANGASDDEINRMKSLMKDRRMAPGQGRGPGKGMGMGMGMGRFMPPEFRMMGQDFHAAAATFADTAGAAATPPTAADYQAAIEALQDVTTVCRTCHDAFRIQ